MKKKVVAALLAVGMLISCLSGCGQKDQPSASQQEKESQDTQQQQSTQPEEKEIEKVIWALRCDPQEDDEKVMAAVNEILRERYNLELEIIPISTGDYNERMRLMITSEEEFDLCFTASYANRFADNVAMGSFLALNDLLETEAAADLMEVYPIDVAGVATVDGNIYALPNYQMLATQEAFYIQKDIAEKYGLTYKNGDRIDSIADLYGFMDKLIDNEEGLFVLNEDTQRKETISTYGVFYDHITSGIYVEKDDETYTARFKLEDPKYVDNLRQMNELYKKGYIRKDVATVTDNSADEKTNRYAIFCNTGKPGGDVETSGKYGEEYIMLYCGEPVMAMNAGISTMTAINVNSKNPEAAIKLYGVMWTDPEVFNLMLYGIEGEHHTLDKDGKVVMKEGTKYTRASYGWMLGNQFNAKLQAGQDDNVWVESEEINQSASVSHLAGFTYNNEAVSTEVAQLSTVAGEFYERFMYVEDFDAWVEEALAKYKTAGIDTVKKDVQAQIDAWRKANGK